MKPNEIDFDTLEHWMLTRNWEELTHAEQAQALAHVASGEEYTQISTTLKRVKEQLLQDAAPISAPKEQKTALLAHFQKKQPVFRKPSFYAAMAAIITMGLAVSIWYFIQVQHSRTTQKELAQTQDGEMLARKETQKEVQTQEQLELSKNENELPADAKHDKNQQIRVDDDYKTKDASAPNPKLNEAPILIVEQEVMEQDSEETVTSTVSAGSIQDERMLPTTSVNKAELIDVMIRKEKKKETEYEEVDWKIFIFTDL